MRPYLLPVLALAACSSPEPLTTAESSGAAVTTINIHDFYYAPASVTVKVGSVVQWVNLGPSTHTATSDNSVWDSGELAVGSAGIPGTTPHPGSTPPPDSTVTPPANPETPLPIPPGSSPETPLPIPPGNTPGTPLPIPPGSTPETPLPIPPGSSPENPLPSPPPGNTPGTPLPSPPPGNTPGTPLPTPPSNDRRPMLAVGSTVFQFTFNTVGTFTFHCSIHPPASYPNFVGTVVVTN